jgi:hypothetical protein
MARTSKIADFAEIGVIFEADKAILPEAAREPCCWRKVRFAAGAEADVNNRIDDKLPFLVADAASGTANMLRILAPLERKSPALLTANGNRNRLPTTWLFRRRIPAYLAEYGWM